MSYLMLKAKTKKEKTLVIEFAERMKLDYKEISLPDYLNQISESRQQIKSGKKISLKELERGI
jgi:hypothetical protein